MQKSASYVLGHTDQELERLVTQARLIDPITRRFFLGAGLAPGMRVLDVGSGAGDVSFLLAELIGATGDVVGVDHSPIAIRTANARKASRALANVSFVEGDPAELKFERPFDAVAGRYVLMFHPDPAAMLHRLATHLRPGGILVFHEPDWDGARSRPPVPTYDRLCQWLVKTFVQSGADPHMGAKLAARMRKEMIASTSTIVGRAEIGAWVRNQA